MRSRVTYVYLCEKEIAHALRLKPQREPFSTNKGNKKKQQKKRNMVSINYYINYSKNT